MKTKPEIEQSLWGPVQSCTKVADGIWYVVGLESHGGYVLSEERARQFKEIMPHFSSSFSSDREFEAHVDCIAVVLAFPELFPKDGVERAAKEAFRLFCSTIYLPIAYAYSVYCERNNIQPFGPPENFHDTTVAMRDDGNHEE